MFKFTVILAVFWLLLALAMLLTDADSTLLTATGACSLICCVWSRVEVLIEQQTATKEASKP